MLQEAQSGEGVCAVSMVSRLMLWRCVFLQDCGTATAEVVAASSGGRNGEDVYTNACATCHNIGLAGAPKFADASSGVLDQIKA